MITGRSFDANSWEDILRVIRTYHTLAWMIKNRNPMQNHHNTSSRHLINVAALDVRCNTMEDCAELLSN
jgi:hypothetical protein